MGADFWIVIQWWGTLFLVGAAAFPLTKTLFKGRWIPGSFGKTQDKQARDDNETGWFDQGYLFSKAVGMAVVTWIVYVLGTLHILPFTSWSIIISLVALFVIGLILQLNQEFGIRNYGVHKGKSIIHNSLFIIQIGKQWKQISVILVEELFFLIALFFWSWVKGHEPSIHGLEKFMDFGFMKSIINSQYFPPADMWYAGLPVNYYYFGHMVVAVLTKLSGIDLVYTFNLMLATIFAFTLTMSFSIGLQISRIGKIGQVGQIGAGILTALLVTLAGNMQTLYAFTKGYTGDNVKPFWELFWPVADFWRKLPEGLNTYWYANATRFIPFTIHEFPSYSFVVSDVHGHVLSIPFVLLAIALLITLFVSFVPDQANHELRIMNYGWKRLGFYGFLVGVLLMTNALDGPIYLALLGAMLIIQNSKFKIQNWGWWKEKGLTFLVVFVTAGLTSLPFLFHFKSFVTGLAVNCPPGFLANQKFGPLLFEGVEKCQRSPLWMMTLLWGFFVYCGGWLVLKVKSQKSKVKSGDQISEIEKLLVVFFVFSLALIIFPEFFYFKDIYPAHFRSNTMFKLGYQAFILFSIVSGYTIVSSFWQAIPHCGRARPESHGDAGRASMTKTRIFLLFLIPQLFLVSIFPIFSVRSYFDSLRNYKGLDGLAWLKSQYPDDWEAIQWLNQEERKRGREEESQKGSPTSPRLRGATMTGLPVIVEADGDSYTDSARFSAFTGLPTIIGWPVHEWLWRGTYDVVAPRREEVRQIYESEDIALTRKILEKYNVRYIIVGSLERQKYTSIALWKLYSLGTSVFTHGQTSILQVQPSQVP